MREERAPILIVTGPSGVGKSTVSRLVAAALGEKSTHVRIDDFTRFVVNGWVEPWLPESSRQNKVLGGAVVVTAMNFAEGGYTVVVDGNVFPDSLEELARACLYRDIPLHDAASGPISTPAWNAPGAGALASVPIQRDSLIFTRGLATSACTRGTSSRPPGRQVR